jgi:hypothetical protein
LDDEETCRLARVAVNSDRCENPKMATRTAKLAKLLEIEGFATSDDFAEAFVTDSVCPAICMSDDCDHTTELEPDQDQGWCEACDTGTMTSGLLLMGLI